MAATVSISSSLINIDRETTASMKRRATQMRSSSLFSGLTWEECSYLAHLSTSKTLARNEFLFQQGHPVRSVSLIEAGAFKLLQTRSNGDEVVLWVSGEGDALGVTPALRNARHTCTAHAVETCTVLSWEADEFHQLCVEFPAISRNVNSILHARLAELEERYCELAIDNVLRRLACAVRRLMVTVGKDDVEGIYIGISRMDLGKMTGIAKFTISRIITEWSNAGLVIPLREALIIRSPSKLHALCNAV